MAAGEKVGSGRRFRSLEHQLARRGDVKNPAGLAAAIGRKKYGKKRMTELAESGRRRAEREQAHRPIDSGRRAKI